MSELDFDPSATEERPPIRMLTKPQRRVLGTLVEKAFTVPESYPMTLKGATVGCNQKSNRSPVSNYTEDAVLQALDELREIGLVAVIHTESGRTERYRHYVRKRFPFSEPQLAIMTELMLRGRQQLGELRARASRMVPIESLDELRKELEGLIQQGYVAASGPLDRRGIEVDHCFYSPDEKQHHAITESATSQSIQSSNRADVSPTTSPSGDAHPASLTEQYQTQIAELRQMQLELQSELEQLRQQLSDLNENVTDLRRSLGA